MHTSHPIISLPLVDQYVLVSTSSMFHWSCNSHQFLLLPIFLNSLSTPNLLHGGTSASKFVHNSFTSSIWLCLEHHIFKNKVIWFSAVFSVKGYFTPRTHYNFIKYHNQMGWIVTKFLLFNNFWHNWQIIIIRITVSLLSLASFLFVGLHLCVGLLLLKVFGTLCHAFF